MMDDDDVFSVCVCCVCVGVLVGRKVSMCEYKLGGFAGDGNGERDNDASVVCR